MPCRAWENRVFYVFSNNVGIDHDTVKPDGAMLLSPCGGVLDECSELGDGTAVATLLAADVAFASGKRCLAARRPEQYAELEVPNEAPSTEPGWRHSREPAAGSGASAASAADISLQPDGQRGVREE